VLNAKNIDKVEKLFVSQLLLLLPFCQHRDEVQKRSMTFPRLLKELAANGSGHLIAEVLSQTTRLFTSSF